MTNLSYNNLFMDEKGRIYKKDDDGEFYRLSLFTDKYYALRAVKGVPMLEIDGIRMHLIRDFETPLDYSRHVIELIKIRKGQKVLDTCGGLGYTAMAAARNGANVTSVELKKEVLNLASQNPYSDGYFKNSHINIVNADSYDYIQDISDKSFDVVIHDPPTYSMAPNLYSEIFYEQVFRVLKMNGLFYHYVGNPNSKYKKKNIYVDTIEKLKKIGFSKIKINRKSQGIICRKE